MQSAFETPPGPPPRGDSLLADVRYGLSFLLDPFAFVGERFARYGDIYYAPSRGEPLFVLRRAAHVREVLVERADAFEKQHTAFEALRGVLGSGLLTSDGDVWRRHRRLANPAFAKRAVEGYAAPMIDVSRAVAERIASMPACDVAEQMTDLTLRVVGRTLFGTEVDAEVARIGAAMRAFQRFLVIPPKLPALLRAPLQKRVQHARDDLDALVAKLCSERRARRVDPPDLVQLLLDATDPDESGASLTPEEVRDEIVTFLLAGHETTSNALAWAFYLLTQHPHVEAQLRAELREVLGDGPPRPADLERLVYTEAVVKETMRLYPPAFVLARRAAVDTTIDRFRVPRGSEVIIWVYFSHRDPAVFPDPERFDPSRFLGGRESAIPRCGYLPFGAGARACIGKSFAMAEAVAAIATIAQRVRFSYAGRDAPRPEGRITLAPRVGRFGAGVPVRVLRP